jgi:hypothetical protein
MNIDCLHACMICHELFTHAQRCDTIADVDICRSCELEGYQVGWCPKCENTQPIAKGMYACDECLTPHVRSA